MSSLVYFIQEGAIGPIKIGMTTSTAESRLMGLQTGNPRKLNLLFSMPGDQEIEKAFHDYFDQYRLIGEWFHFSGELEHFISLIGTDQFYQSIEMILVEYDLDLAVTNEH